MKKMICFMMGVVLCIALTACSSTANADQAATGGVQNESTQDMAEPETSTEESVSETVPAEAESEEIANVETDHQTGTLVVYFSCTGTTKTLAEYLAAGLGADIYEIVPEDPYTSEDLDYHDDNSRSTQEMDDPSSRPAISGSVENMGQYEIVIISYPIWWGEAPRIVDSFVESYDFSGKTIIPFCTSGGSGIGSSADTLEELAGTGTWMEGTRFDGSESQEDMLNWFQGLGIE